MTSCPPLEGRVDPPRFGVTGLPGACFGSVESRSGPTGLSRDSLKGVFQLSAYRGFAAASRPGARGRSFGRSLPQAYRGQRLAPRHGVGQRRAHLTDETLPVLRIAEPARRELRGMDLQVGADKFRMTLHGLLGIRPTIAKRPGGLRPGLEERALLDDPPIPMIAAIGQPQEIRFAIAMTPSTMTRMTAIGVAQARILVCSAFAPVRNGEDWAKAGVQAAMIASPSPMLTARRVSARRSVLMAHPRGDSECAYRTTCAADAGTRVSRKIGRYSGTRQEQLIYSRQRLLCNVTGDVRDGVDNSRECEPLISRSLGWTVG